MRLQRSQRRAAGMDASRGLGTTWGAGGFGAGAGAAAAACALVPPSTPATSPRSTASQAASWPRTAMGAATLANIGKGSAENQDAFVTSANPSGTKCFVGVFDGHGEKGGKISNFSRTMITKLLFANKDLHTDPRGALEGAIDETQRQIEREYNHDAAYSGTTAVAAYQHRDKLIVANVGDSRAVLGSCATPGGAESPSLKAIELSSDHKPSRPDEKRRITSEGGVVQQSAVPVQTPGGGVRLVRMGPERVMDKGGFGGLAVSRSLGDLSLRPYVSSQPEVTERRLGPKDKVLILGSDGVWDRISSQEAVNIAARHGDPVQAARMITSVARKRWQAETQGMLADDITAVVVTLDHDGSSAGASPTPDRQETSPVSQPSQSAQAAGVLPGQPLRRKPSESTLAETVTPMPRSRRSTSTSAAGREAEIGDAHRPLTGGPEGYARHGDRLRRHKTAGHVGLESLRRPATGNTHVPNHLLPPAGRR